MYNSSEPSIGWSAINEKDILYQSLGWKINVHILPSSESEEKTIFAAIKSILESFSEVSLRRNTAGTFTIAL